MNLPDVEAESIGFGVELETYVPRGVVPIGTYHCGVPVDVANCVGERVFAPSFESKWRAERDSSIIPPDASFEACEFVSPILQGVRGVEHLLAFVQFAKRIDAAVNKSCGCHITVNVAPLTSTSTCGRVGFVRRLARHVQRHALAIYAQTGTGRHESTYAAPLPSNTGELTNEMMRTDAIERVRVIAELLGRGIVNFRKYAASGLVEFRAFAGTLNEKKLMHHLATALGLCRLAASASFTPTFGLAGSLAPKNGAEALERMWTTLGWKERGVGRDVTLGMFGILHDRWIEHSAEALRLAKRYDEKYPKPILMRSV